MKIFKNKQPIISFLQISELRKILFSLFALSLAVIVGSLLLYIMGFSPVKVYKIIFSAWLLDSYNFSLTIQYTIPLIFTGLAVAIPARAGLFNIGGEGQFIMGAFVAAIVGIYIRGIPMLLHILLCFLIAGIIGAALAYLPAVLKLKANSSEIVTTVLINSICLIVVEYLVNYPFRGTPFAPETLPIQASALFPRIAGIPSAIIFGILVAIGSYSLLFRSVWGFEVRSVGLNPITSKYKGINVSFIGISTMIIGGACAAIGGASHVLGVYDRFVLGMGAGLGYSGIAVSMMAFNNPISVLPAAFLISLLRVGGMELDLTTTVPVQVTSMIEGLVIIFMALPAITSISLNFFKRKKMTLGNQAKRVTQ